jgi:peptidoglycan/LPS O-acetylase OafA/YrhL
MLLGMKRLECLDGLRGVLAVYVLLGHMAPFATLPAWIEDSVSHGNAAVEVFFILSGLVITQSLYRAGGRAGPFLTARAARIFPLFLPVFAFAVMIQATPCGFDRMPWVGPDGVARTICNGSAWPDNWPTQILAHLTMIHGLSPSGVSPDLWVGFLGSAWSLSTEWQFYLLLLVGFAGPERLRNHLMLLAVAGVAWQWCAPDDWQFSRAFLANKAHFFALGVTSLALVQRRRGALAAYCTALAVTLAICATRESVGKMLAPLVWTLCLAAQLHPDRVGLRQISRFLRSATMQYLGAISYGIYLVNEPIHKLVANGLSHLADGDAMVFTVLWIPTAVLLPILVATWLHSQIEQPAIGWGHRVTHAWFA